MQENTFIDYFHAEKTESLFFLIIGILGILVGIWIWRNSANYKNIIYPIFIISLIQIVVGSSVYFRTDKQVEDLLMKQKQNLVEFKNLEIDRMKVVNRNFEYYKAFEIFLIATGIILSYLFPNRIEIYSIAIGLILESSLMLVLDLFAEKRAIDYLEFIQNLNAN